MNNTNVKIVLGTDADLPVCATAGSAGYDLRSTTDIVIGPGCQALIPTNLKVQLPENVAMLIMPRSGLAAKQSVTVLNSPGLIDSDYRGVVHVLLINHNYLPCTIQKGDRIAQAVFINVVHPNFTVVDELDASTRDVGGFGSTGKS